MASRGGLVETLLAAIIAVAGCGGGQRVATGAPPMNAETSVAGSLAGYTYTAATTLQNDQICATFAPAAKGGLPTGQLQTCISRAQFEAPSNVDAAAFARLGGHEDGIVFVLVNPGVKSVGVVLGNGPGPHTSTSPLARSGYAYTVIATPLGKNELREIDDYNTTGAKISRTLCPSPKPILTAEEGGTCRSAVIG